MTERFEANDYYHFILDNETNHEISVTEATELLNQLYKENQEIKQLLHTMLNQIDAEKINTDNTIFSARILFTIKEFMKIKEIWNERKELYK